MKLTNEQLREALLKLPNTATTDVESVSLVDGKIVLKGGKAAQTSAPRKKEEVKDAKPESV